MNFFGEIRHCNPVERAPRDVKSKMKRQYKDDYLKLRYNLAWAL